MLRKHALVVGATGVVGSAIARRLVDTGSWDVTCATRSGDAIDGAAGLSIDLLDAAAIESAGAKTAPVTHLFYAAYQSKPSRSEEVEPNVAMLRNSVALAQRHGRLRRVVIVSGAKYYGVQWGAIKTPARESDARHLGPNFYYGQLDHLAAQSAAGGWTWTNLMPATVTGVSVRAPMNLVAVLGALGTLSRELGFPLRFPGPAASWNSLHHLADASQVAHAAIWAADSDAAADHSFNVANGDPGRWKHVWPHIAGYFDVDAGEPLTIPLSQIPDAFGDAWRDLAHRYRLCQPDIGALVDWRWADYMFNTAFAHDVVLETGKIRRAGFHACIDSELTLMGRFDELRALRLIP
ncbi:MAG: NAD-dependent epimerase/dehydratase family protein [Burkholderiales bacterium]|nr:NAD-dependent epimerase/dehydratase family protein [Burkholderiales bacterium]